MERLLDEQLVQRDTLTFRESFQQQQGRKRKLVLVQLRGRVECVHGVVVSVYKRLEVRSPKKGQPEVCTRSYNYHAWIPAKKQDLLRYDDAHGPLHRHIFDTAKGRETAMEAVALDDLPTLDEVIREAIELGRVIDERA